jgi:hypothetical protein
MATEREGNRERGPEEEGVTRERRPHGRKGGGALGRELVELQVGSSNSRREEPQ